MDILQPLKRLYFRIGVHTAPPGTLLNAANKRAFSLAFSSRMRALRWRLIAEQRGEFFSIAGTHVRYDIARARTTRPVDGLALVFFMGLGDYLMAMPLLQALRAAYPELPLHAYASTTLDQVNSPLLAAQARGRSVHCQDVPLSGPAGDRSRTCGRMLEELHDYSEALQDDAREFPDTCRCCMILTRQCRTA